MQDKEIRGAPVGDTIVKANSGTPNLEGFQEVNPQVYAALFPQNSDDFEAFREALENSASMMPRYNMNLNILRL